MAIVFNFNKMKGVHPTLNVPLRIQTEEIVTVSGTNVYNIPDKLNLVDKYKIAGFGIRRAAASRESYLSGSALVSDNVLDASHITFKDKKRNDWASFPLEYAAFEPTDNSADIFWFQQPMSINLAESTIVCKDTTNLDSGVGNVYEIVFFVVDNDIC